MSKRRLFLTAFLFIIGMDRLAMKVKEDEMRDEQCPGEADEAAADQASCVEPVQPHALTREQVEEAIMLTLSPDERAIDAREALRDHDAAQRQALAKEPLHEGECLSCMKLADTLAQQAQELERLRREKNAVVIELYRKLDAKDEKLAAMTAERDAFKQNALDKLKQRVAWEETVDLLQDKLTASEQEAGRLRELLALSKCGVCTGCGWYEDTDRLTGEPVQVQCRYCCEAQQALKGDG